MFLKPGPQNPNEFTLVAPTGFEPVFRLRQLLSLQHPSSSRVLLTQHRLRIGRGIEPAAVGAEVVVQ